MKTAVSVLFLLELSGLASLRAADLRVQGQVFVATAGGESIKLGDVEVQLLPGAPTREYLLNRTLESEKLLADITIPANEIIKFYEDAKAAEDLATHAWIYGSNDKTLEAKYKAAGEAERVASEYGYDAKASLTYPTSGLFYFEKLPPHLQVTRTDADGKYSFTLPGRGEYVIAAQASRKVADRTEWYYWFVNYQVVDDAGTINLANVNLASSGNVASLVHIKQTEMDYAATGRAKVEKLPELAALVARLREEESRKSQAEEQEKKTASERVREVQERQLRLNQEERRAVYVRAHLPELVKQSQARAVAAHPELTKAGSALNARFVAACKKLMDAKSERLNSPDWPERLADECAATP